MTGKPPPREKGGKDQLVRFYIGVIQKPLRMKSLRGFKNGKRADLPKTLG